MNKKPKKGKKRRDQTPNAALQKSYTPRVRQEYLDYDYLDQLNAEELAWLNKFTEEYLNASFKRDGTDIQSYEKYGKDSNDRNNSRNRDLYGNLKNKDNKFKNNKLLDYEELANTDGYTGEGYNIVEKELSRDINPRSIEAAYVEFLDYKQVEEMMLEYDLAMEQFSEEVSECQELLQQPTPQPQEP